MAHIRKRDNVASIMDRRALDLERKGVEMSQVMAQRGTEVSRNVADRMHRMAEEIRNLDTSRYTAGIEHNVCTMRTNIREHPLACVVLAAGAGIIVGIAMAILARHSVREY